MNDVCSNPGQEIEKEVGLPAELVLYEYPKDPEEDGIPKDVPEIGVEEHGSDELPGILVPGSGVEIISDPKSYVPRGFVKGDKDGPVNKEEAYRRPWDMLQG